MNETDLRAPLRLTPHDRSQDDDNKPWIWIGFQLGLGFSIAAAIVSAICTWIVWIAMTHTIETNLSKLKAETRRLPPAPVQVPAPEAYDATPEPQVLVVPPRSVEACKALTGGQINEDFARCRRGYTEVR